jgi:8-oxo-dGTP pyrophosphatase MutT (NUDIX family)
MRTRFKKLIITLGYTAYKIVRIPIKWYWRLFNIKTRGVRVMIVYQDKIILVRHWYNSLWVMPGGGIKKHETPEQAAIREVKEELGISIGQLDYLLGVYSNIKEDKKDTVYCFVVELKEKLEIPRRRFNIEIADAIWVGIKNLPTDTSKSTRNRIFEHIKQDITKEIRPW